MEKKSTKKAQQTKRALIDSAIRVIHEKGYRNTTLEDIAFGAGFTRGALYWHFKGKAEIVISIYNDFIKKLDKIVARTIDKENATINSVADFVKEANNMLITDSDFSIVIELLLFKTELSRELEIIAERDKQWVIANINKISFLIENHRKVNNLNMDIDSKEIALSIVAMYRGLGFIYSYNRQIFPHEDSHIRIVDAFFQNILSHNNK